MHKILISLPDQLVIRMRTTIPERQRSKIVATLLEAEILKREKSLYECALAVEKDMALKADMAAWNITISDGLSDEEPKIQNSSREAEE